MEIWFPVTSDGEVQDWVDWWKRSSTWPLTGRCLVMSKLAQSKLFVISLGILIDCVHWRLWLEEGNVGDSFSAHQGPLWAREGMAKGIPLFLVGCIKLGGCEIGKVNLGEG